MYCDPNGQPIVLFASGPTHQAYQDCSSAAVLRRHDADLVSGCQRDVDFASTRNSDLRLVSNEIIFSTLDDEHVVCSTKKKSAIVLNRPACTLMSCFRVDEPASHDLGDLELQWGRSALEAVLTKMLQAGLLRNDGIGDSVDRSYHSELSAWIHVTDRCNLRCRYCYLPHKPLDMSLDTGIASLEAVFRSAVAHSSDSVTLKYAGGEPLLRFGLVQQLHRYSRLRGSQQNLDVQGVLLSNGTLITQEIASAIQDLELQLVVSLDGIGPANDCQRLHRNGEGSFRDVENAISIVMRKGVVPVITITVSQRNAEHLSEIVSWVLDRDLPFSLSFYRENDLSASEASPQTDEWRSVI